jgi:hypothetical protein
VHREISIWIENCVKKRITYCEVGVVYKLICDAVIGQERLWGLLRNGSGNPFAIITARVMAGKRHEAFNQDELGSFSGHLSEPHENLGGVSIGPVMEYMFEQEDRRIRNRLGRKEIVSYFENKIKSVFT